MRFAGRRRTAIGSAVLMISLAGFMAFQNCSSPMEGALFAKTELESFSEGAPFAYDATVDEIAYNSCSEFSNYYNHQAFYTFKAGAYNTGGIKLTPDFRTYISKLKPTDDSRLVLGYSSLNGNVVPQLDIRIRGNLTARSILSSGSGGDYGILMDPLSQYDISDALLKASTSQRLRIFSDPTGGSPRRFETVLGVNNNEGTALYVRNYLTTTASLTLVFTDFDGTGNTPPKSPVSAAGSSSAYQQRQTVYGRSYALNFTRPTPSDFGQGGGVSDQIPNRVLASVSETNLDLVTRIGEGPSTWTCPLSLRLKVVRPGDEAVAGCRKMTDPTTADATLRYVRNVLPVEYWYVDLANHCVVQKDPNFGQCYGAATKVNYDLSQTCAQGDTTNGNCAHFVSICYR